MSKIWENRWLPIIVAVVLFLIYGIADSMFVQCFRGYFCEAINTENISQVTAGDDKDLKKIPAELEKNRLSGDVKAGEIKAKNKEIADKQTAIEDKTREIEQTEDAELKKKLTKEKGVLEKEKTKLEADLTALTNEQTAINNKNPEIRKQVSTRYANRMTWVLLTGSFFLLCLAAVAVSLYAIKESVEGKPTEDKPAKIKRSTVWIIFTLLIAVIFAFVVFNRAENYMSIVLPMFNQSIFKYDDISKNAINFFNVLGFAATICLISASAAIMTGILETKAKNAANPKPDPPLTFEKYEQQIKAVLYIGALMLFVGMLRVKLLSDWHLSFVSADPNNPNYQLLASFFKTSIGVQAFFYTVLLAVIYLPVAYAIDSQPKEPEKNNGDAKKDENTASGFWGKLGLVFSGEFTARLIAVISPFLAGPIAELFKFLVGKTS